MTQQPYIILLQGGLDLVTQQIAMPDGRAISCLNYEPDVSGVTSTGGCERYDGRTSPSSSTDAATIAALRALIAKVPGSGPVRGVYVYAGELWAFRDQVDGTAAMFKATSAGWVQQTFGYTLDFTTGTLEFLEGQTVTGGTSGATATIQRVVLTSGVWNGTAAGYLVLSGLSDIGNDSYTKILLHMDGVDASTTFTDSNVGGSAHAWTAAGNAQIDTAQSTFGGASGLFDGTGDWITTPDSADFTLGSSDWTIDCWIKSNSTGTTEYFWGQSDNAATAATISTRINRSASGVISAQVYVGGTPIAVNGTTVITNAVNPGFNHVALVRTGNVLKLFINGVQEGGNVALVGSVQDSANAFRIGAPGEVTSNTWNGWIDEFRLSVGIARWTADFTAPAAPFGKSFQSETITSSSGSATASAAQVAIALSPGGIYKFETHNFYGAAKSARLYFVNGIGTAFEWDGTVLAPIRTGIDTGSTFSYLMTDAGSPNRVLTDNGVDRIIVDSTAVDNPSFIGVYRNHLFFGYAVGAIVFSGPGVPLDYRTSAGAGTFAFGDAMTAMLVSATALVIFGRGLIEYVAGNDVDDFQKLEITEAAGAVLESPQVYGESPLYLDDGGLRKLSSTAAYGDFKTGTVTQLLEPLFRQKRLAGIVPATALVVTAKDQYRLYWNDGSGVVLYMGRKYPESLPFKLPVTFFSSCVGEMDPGMGDRLFAGGTDGYVYELDKGTSFDGAAIDAYIQIAYNNLNSPRTNKRFHRYFGDVVCPDPITVGVVFDVDYGGEPAGQTNADATAGMPLVGTDAYASIDWQRAVQGQFSCDLDGVGRNIAVTHITSSSTARQHTFPSSTINSSPRGPVRQ